nr:MAG TPA_asm: hypothetical protein [Caudoviricetes sp.]
MYMWAEQVYSGATPLADSLPPPTIRPFSKKTKKIQKST